MVILDHHDDDMTVSQAPGRWPTKTHSPRPPSREGGATTNNKYFFLHRRTTQHKERNQKRQAREICQDNTHRTSQGERTTLCAAELQPPDPNEQELTTADHTDMQHQRVRHLTRWFPHVEQASSTKPSWWSPTTPPSYKSSIPPCP